MKEDLHNAQQDKRTDDYLRMEFCQNIDFLATAYGLYFDLGGPDELDNQHGISGTRASVEEAYYAIRQVREEVTKYPRAYVDACNINFIKIVDTLTFREKGITREIEGLSYSRTRNIHLSTRNLYIPQTLHHEAYHRSEQEALSIPLLPPPISAYCLKRNTRLFEVFWANHNPGSTKYLGSEYQNLNAVQRNQLDATGFARTYGMVDGAEDRATIAELIMTYPTLAVARCKADPIFKGKVREVMSHFEKRSKGLMNAAYFEDLARGNIREGYWTKPPIRLK